MALRILHRLRLIDFVGVSLIIIITSCTGLTVDHQTPFTTCLYNNCLNGGICYTVSDGRPDRIPVCPSGFTLLEEHGCFMFSQHRVSRLDAMKICQQRSAVLSGAGPARMLRLGEFVQQQQMNAKSTPHDPLNIWVNVNSKWPGPLSSHTKPSLTRTPSPPSFSKRTTCYALQASTTTATTTIPVACDARLPFICEVNLSATSAVDATSGDPNGFHQCQCRQQYEGPWCQIRLAAGVDSYGTGLKCADDVIHLTCPAGSRVEIDYAMYGEIMNKVNVCTATSTGEMAQFNPDCMHAGALIWMKELCHGRETCTGSVKSLAAVSPCPDTPLQLQYRYRCVPQTTAQCSVGQFLLDGWCYEIFNKFKATWDEARMFCQLYGGELPSVSTMDSETVVIQTISREMNFTLQQTVQLWAGYRHSSREIHDDSVSARLSGNFTSIAVWNETLIDYNGLPSSWVKNLKGNFSHSRTKRDDQVEEDTCLGLTVTKNKNLDGSYGTVSTWILTSCIRKIGWMCRFPAGLKAPATADDEPPEDPIVVQARSVPIATPTPAPRASNPFSAAFTQENGNARRPTPAWPAISPLPTMAPLPDLNLTFSPMPSIPHIPEIPPLTTLYPQHRQRREECAEITFDGQLWQRVLTGTFVVHPCFNDGNAARLLDDDTVHYVRTIVEQFAPEQVHLFDANAAKYPYGFTFWTCVATMGGPRYVPTEGPVTKLCEYTGTSRTAQTTPLPTMRSASGTVEELANYAASGGLSGAQILQSVGILQTMLTEQTKQTKAVAASRTMDFEVRMQSVNATQQFVNVVSRSVSNMLMDVHRPGWSELDEGERSGAATGLIRAAEESAAMLAIAYRDSSMNTRVAYSNFAMEVSIFPAKSLNRSLTYNTSEPDSQLKSTDPAAAKGYNMLALPDSIRSYSGPDGNLRLAFMQYSEALSTLLSPIAPNQTGNGTLRANETLFGMVNSKIVAASVIQNGQMSSTVKLNNSGVTLILAHTYANGVKPRCVFWNMQNHSDPFWDSAGCWMAESNETHTACSCNHLTNFAVLMDLNGQLQHISRANKLALDIISYVGCVISIICLSLCLIIFTFFRQLWCDRITIHRNLVFCLLTAQFVFVLGVDRVYNQIGCSITAGILHYTLLASFAWMLLEGLQLYMMLVQVFESEDSHQVYYYAFGYGFPAIIVAVAAGIRPDHYGTSKYCWLLPADGFVWSFVGPVALVVGINMMFLVIALMAVFRTKSPARQQNGFQKMRGWLRGSIMLLCLLGTTWLFGLLYINYASTLVFAYLFTIANSLQGLFIFIFHCIMNDKVFATVQRYINRCRWCPQCLKSCIGTPKTGSTSGSNSKTSSHSMKDGSHSRHNSTSMWNFLKKRGATHRLSMESSLSMQLPIGKHVYDCDSDYWSKTSSCKSNHRVPYGRQRSKPSPGKGDEDSVRSAPNSIHGKVKGQAKLHVTKSLERKPEAGFQWKSRSNDTTLC